MKDYLLDFNLDTSVCNETYAHKIRLLYAKHFGREPTASQIEDVFRLYNWHCQMLNDQFNKHKVTKTEKDELGNDVFYFDDYKFIFWTRYEDLDAYIKGLKHTEDESLERSKVIQEWLKRPWYERELPSSDESWKEVAKKFLDSDLFRKLCSYWDFDNEQVNEIAKWYIENFRNDKKYVANEFCTSDVISWCNGICGDGERVFRTAVVIFSKIKDS